MFFSCKKAFALSVLPTFNDTPNVREGIHVCVTTSETAIFISMILIFSLQMLSLTYGETAASLLVLSFYCQVALPIAFQVFPAYWIHFIFKCKQPRNDMQQVIVWWVVYQSSTKVFQLCQAPLCLVAFLLVYNVFMKHFSMLVIDIFMFMHL